MWVLTARLSLPRPPELLADLSLQKIDLGFDGSLRRNAALEDARRTIQQLLLPVVDLVRVDEVVIDDAGGTRKPNCLVRGGVRSSPPLH